MSQFCRASAAAGLWTLGLLLSPPQVAFAQFSSRPADLSSSVTLDEAGADLLLVEAVPDEPEWLAVRDRLTRAASRDLSDDEP